MHNMIVISFKYIYSKDCKRKCTVFDVKDGAKKQTAKEMDKMHTVTV